MAIHKSAKKRILRNAHRAEINTHRRSTIRTYIRKVMEAITAGDQPAAQLALKVAQPEIQRGAMKGLMHKKAASRKISRLAAAIKRMKENISKK